MLSLFLAATLLTAQPATQPATQPAETTLDMTTLEMTEEVRWMLFSARAGNDKRIAEHVASGEFSDAELYSGLLNLMSSPVEDAQRLAGVRAFVDGGLPIDVMLVVPGAAEPQDGGAMLLLMAALKRDRETFDLLRAAGADVDDTWAATLPLGIKSGQPLPPTSMNVAFQVAISPQMYPMLTEVNFPVPLHAAAAAGDLERVKALLDKGYSPSEPALSPPLSYAAYNGHADIVDLLLAAGAPAAPDQTNAAPLAAGLGGLPLQHAALNGRLDVVNKLVAAGADPDDVTVKGEPLEQAVRKAYLSNKSEILEALGYDAD